MGILAKFDITGRSALVTGAASGIGLCYAEAMAEGGARVTLSDLDRDAVERDFWPHVLSGRIRPVLDGAFPLADAEAALKTCEEIDRLESAADRVMRSAMSKLFREEPDVREVIKLKAIYELLETITDKCEDVANVIEGIVLENS